jgi:hypothetical protein
MNLLKTYKLAERYADVPTEKSAPEPVPIVTEETAPKTKLKLKSTPAPKNGGKGSGSIEEKLDMVLMEFEELKNMHRKLLTENNIIPKNSEEMYLQVGGHLFKGNMQLIDKK